MARRSPGPTTRPPLPIRRTGRRSSAGGSPKTVDPFGNTIQYEYERDAGDTPGHHWDQLYLKRIRYADYTEPAPERVRRGGFLVSVTFVYEERPDPFSDHRAGLRDPHPPALHPHRDPHPRRPRAPGPRLSPDLPRPARAAARAAAAERDVAAQPGARRGPRRRRCARRCRRWSSATRRSSRRERRYQPLGAGGSRPERSLGHPEFELVDLFGNGLPDIVEMNERVRYWRNLGGGRFDLARTMQTAPAGVRLSEPGVQLLDADGNGRADLMVATDVRAGYYPLTFAGEWDERGFVRYRSGPDDQPRRPGRAPPRSRRRRRDRRAAHRPAVRALLQRPRAGMGGCRAARADRRRCLPRRQLRRPPRQARRT